MSKRKIANSNPRIKIHENGRATLSGLSYQDLRSLICGASIYSHEMLEKVRKNKDLEHVRAEHMAYHEHELNISKLANESMQEQFRLSHNRSIHVPTKAERLTAVKYERKERLLIESIIVDLVKDRGTETPLKALGKLIKSWDEPLTDKDGMEV